jgi:hypothetical protein
MKGTKSFLFTKVQDKMSVSLTGTSSPIMLSININNVSIEVTE